MPAIYPGDIRHFTTKIDFEHTVYALHMNDVQDEITAIQAVLGANPQGGATSPATVGRRLTILEGGSLAAKSDTTHDHSNRLDAAAHDTVGRHAFGGALGTPDNPAALAFGSVTVVGTGDNPSKEDHGHRMPTVREAQDALIPAGTIWAYGGTAAPAGWAMCDGASLVRPVNPPDQYYALYQAIGTRYGSADGTHFSLPDLRGRFPMGGATTGAAVVSGGSRNAVLVSHAHGGSGVGNGGADHQHYVDHTHQTGWYGDHEHGTDPTFGARGIDSVAFAAASGPYRLTDVGSQPLISFTRIETIMNPAGGHDHGTYGMQGRQYTDGATNSGAYHGHGLTIQPEGVSATDANLPPYQTCNWIIKV